MIGRLNDEVFKLIRVHGTLRFIRYAIIYCLTVFGFVITVCFFRNRLYVVHQCMVILFNLLKDNFLSTNLLIIYQ